MPIFDYKCNGCKNEFEELLRTKEQVVRCPKCKSDDVARFLMCKNEGSHVGFKFIGSGFYTNDYKNKGKKEW